MLTHQHEPYMNSSVTLESTNTDSHSPAFVSLPTPVRNIQNTLITLQFTAKLMHFNSVELYNPLATIFRMGSYQLLQELGCELLKLVACELFSSGLGGQ